VKIVNDFFYSQPKPKATNTYALSQKKKTPDFKPNKKITNSTKKQVPFENTEQKE
jgi:hypothetical protein